MTESSTPDWLGLGGTVAVVVGAAAGIGRSIAETLLAADARVALLGRDEAALKTTAAEIDPDGGRTFVRRCDVTLAGDAEAAAAAIEADFGPVDTVVINAAVMRPGKLDEVDLADFAAQFDTNVVGALRAARAFGRAMLERGHGSLVHVASIAAGHPQPFSGGYSPSKAAVLMLARQLAVEWGPRGLRSNVVSPGLVEAPMSRAFYAVPGIREKREAVVPLRRIGRPQDMADAVVFLASPRASYVNGEEIVVDGGYTRTLMAQIPRPGY